MKLTAFSKILLTLIFLVLLYFLYLKISPSLGIETERTATNTEVASDNGATKAAPTSKSNPSTQKTTTTRPFNYVAPKPVNGKLRGVVELGASGFNSFIVNMDPNNRWELKKAEWGNSLVYDNMASSQDIRSGLKKYITNILDYGVDGRDIHFVVSSGAQKVPNTLKIIKELKNMGYVVNTVSPEQEAKYALKAALPPAYKSKAFVVDIGSGNTKISWVDRTGTTEGLETYGAKYYKNNTDDQTVYQDVFTKAKSIPKDKRNACFIIGGVPYKLAKEVRKGKERYTVLKSPEAYNPEGAKMKSGLNIYRAIKDATHCDQYIFDWDANFTIGFLLGLK